MLQNLIGHAFKVGCFGPMAFLGAMILASAVESVFIGPFDLGEFVLKIIGAFAFGGVGGGALYALYGHEHLYPLWRQYRVERWGDRPWMRKKAWRRGRIPYRKPAPTLFLWVFALGWNSMLTTVLWGNRDIIALEIKENGLVVLPIGLFVLLGLGVLWGAVHSTFARRYADRGLFVMASVPAWTGGRLEGTIETRIPAGLKKQVTLKLTSTGGAPIEVNVPPDTVLEGPKGLAIPVAMEIPRSAAPTDEFDPKLKVIWTLEARMKLPGNAFAARFRVPVYRKAQEE